MSTDYAQRRFTVEEYVRMTEVGILGYDERVELLDGVVVTMPPIGEPHAAVCTALQYLLGPQFLKRAVIRTEKPVELSGFSLPQPDIALLAWDARFYRDRRPRVADVFALIEVSDSTLRYNRGAKLREYARTRVPEYWLVNIQEEVLEIYREPNDLSYASKLVLRKGDHASFLAFPDDRLAVTDLLLLNG